MHTIFQQRRSLASLPRPPGSWHQFVGSLTDRSRTLLERILTWQERASQRWALRQLDDRMLKDVGLSRADVAREADKPFWIG